MITTILIISLSNISKGFLKNLKTNAKIIVYSPHSTIEEFDCLNSFDKITTVFNYIFLGCKPQHLEDVAKKLPPHLYDENTIFISVLAGTKAEAISSQFKTGKVFRAMPSLAFELGNSFVASFSHGLSAKEKQLVTEMFKPNSVIYCQNENEIDEFTAMYGSGIGFVFEIMQAFLQASESFLPHTNKQEIITNLFQNAAAYLQNKNISFVDATQKVASKGGTTEAGLNILRHSNALKNIIAQTMQASLKRAKELSK
jgi:pyrroline-5-carboxylate reductase